ncbi:MAG: SDR family oxidoreductase [Elusimicrobiota bacterium]|jgi:dTDP-4-dehydrorhamnose reductase
MVSPQRVLVIGAAGLIGNALVRAWERRGAEVLGCDRVCRPGGPFVTLDFTHEGQVASLLREFRPGIVAVPAARPHVDYCEAHPEETRLANVLAPALVSRLCYQTGSVMVFYSSDYVFDGSKPSYGEDDPVCPVNEYGRQKVEAEEAVLACGRHLVIRSSGVYGWQWVPKNFVLQVLTALRESRALRVPHDIRYNPTSAENLAEVTAELCGHGAAGIFHVVGRDRLARSEFAQEVARVFGLDAGLIEPVEVESLMGTPVPSGNGGRALRPAPGDPKRPSGVTPGTAGSGVLPAAPRPKESSLRTDKVRALSRAPLWGAAQGLQDMVRQKTAWEEYCRTSLPTAGAI